MICLVWATLTFSSLVEAFNHLDQLSVGKRVSANIVVEKEKVIVRLCEKYD